MVVTFATELNTSFWRFLWAIAALVGFLWAGSAILKMARASRFPGQSPVTFGDILPLLILAAIILNLSGFINNVLTSIGLGTTSYGPLSYSGAAAVGGRFQETVNAALTIAAMFGGYFCIKGILLWKKAWGGHQGQGEDFVWKGIVHAVGGAILVNIPRFLEYAQTSLGIAW
ncbi:hypothetical protein F953_00526 [Acinetobacter junii CIP 107470 = MTCC 11364]|nr:hypothetical protein F953_00526 [Acinetobacter junii CIP 107470 = MTCC 11364]